jgi:hypothetical protein
MLGVALSLMLLAQRPSDVCVIAPDAVLVEPGKVNWLLRDPAFRVPRGTRASVLRINPEQTEGVAEIRLIDATRRVAWVESSSLTPIQDILFANARPVTPQPAKAIARVPKSQPDKPYGITAQQAKRERRAAENAAYDAALFNVSQGLANQTLASRQFGGAGVGSASSTSHLCGAVTKTTNAPCMNRVAQPGYCYLHR